MERAAWSGMHEAYRQLGFDAVAEVPLPRFPRKSAAYRHGADARGSVRRLEQDFLPLEKLYRMMDHLTGRVELRVGSATQALLPEFERAVLRLHGSRSPRMNSNRVSARPSTIRCRALMGRRCGVPVPPEGHSFIPVQGRAAASPTRRDRAANPEWKRRARIHRGRPANLPKTRKFTRGRWNVQGCGCAQAARARKDQAVEKLIKKLGKSDRIPGRFITIDGDARLMLIRDCWNLARCVPAPWCWRASPGSTTRLAIRGSGAAGSVFQNLPAKQRTCCRIPASTIVAKCMRG